MESTKHKLLKQVAIRWLQGTGCVAWATEVRWYFCGIPDAMGIKAKGDVYVVEAKDTTADLRSDFKPKGYAITMTKSWKLQQTRDVDFVYYIVSDGVDTARLPAWIGILDENGRVRRNAKRRGDSRTAKNKAANFELIARKLSWRTYGYVIRGEQKQEEFSLTGGTER